MGNLSLFGLFGLGILLFVVGVASNYLAALLPTPRQVPRWSLIVSGMVLALLSGVLTVTQADVPAESPASGAPASFPPPAGSGVAASRPPEVRQLSQWASEVEAICEPMVPALEADVAALGAIDHSKVQANDAAETGKLVSALRDFHDHYAVLNGQIQDVEPPTHSAEAVAEWLRLFDERGQKLYAGIEQLESGGIIDRLRSALAMSTYGSDTDMALAKAKQLGVESCP